MGHTAKGINLTEKSIRYLYNSLVNFPYINALEVHISRPDFIRVIEVDK